MQIKGLNGLCGFLFEGKSHFGGTEYRHVARRGLLAIGLDPKEYFHRNHICVRL